MRTSALLVFVALAASAAPLGQGVEKRILTCWSDNVEGCIYGTTGTQAAVATEIGTCSEIGVEIIQQGGNAADAMIASALCVGTIAGYHSGIAGGGFMVVRYNTDGGQAYETIDFRETAPGGANETMYSMYGANQTKSTIGGLAVAVPAEVRGWEALHSRHGSLPWADLFAPAIKLARYGFPVNQDLATCLEGRTFMLNDTNWSEAYAPNGTLLTLGQTCYRKKYADTLEKLAEHGAKAFYSGPIAQNIVDKIQANGGILTLDDLANYTVRVKNASTIEYRGKKIFSTVSPSSGAITLSALKIFEGFNGSAKDTDRAINLTTQRLVESTKFAYGQRATLGDPAFTANVSMLEKSYLTEQVASAVRSRIVQGKTFPAGYYNPSNYYPTRESGTSHLATADGTGMSVSLTTTVNLLWGSQLMTDDGIILNDEMDDFSSPGQVNAFGFAASPINYIVPGKRPQSSICSSIVEDENGQFVMATGSAGGSRIITATIQELHHYIDQGLNATDSSRHPRWHDQLSGMTFFEYPDPSRGLAGYDNSTVASFRDIGYNISYTAPFDGSTSHAITRLPNGELLAASDPRKVAGYGAAV